MYEQFFGLTEKPFSIQPDPSFLYWGRTHRLAYAMLEYGVLNHAGISVITGEVGCGKTTLIHRLLDQLSDTHTVALLSNIQHGRGDLLSWVLMSFGQPHAGKTHVEMFSDLQTFFIGEYAKGKRIVLIIDEAQNLPADMLEELRLLSNINAGKDQLLQLILVGQPQLKELLNRPELLQLAQRVGSDFHLTPLTGKEVESYIETRLAIAGCKRRIFTERAIDMLAEQSHGVPRVINIIADTALVYAFSAGDLVVGVETIRAVVRDKTKYGVFGLAAEDALQPAPDEDDGPDAFVRPPAPDAPNSEAPALRDDSASDESTPAVHNQPMHFGDAGPEPRRETVSLARTVADLKTTVQSVADVKATPYVQQTDDAADLQPAPTRASPVEESAVTGVVVIGGEKDASPEAAIRSVGDSRAVVFVSTGRNQAALAIARNSGAVVVDDLGRANVTGGRARNAGYRQLKKIAPHIRYVQFLDADCALDPDWIGEAQRFMDRRPEVAVVEGQVLSLAGLTIDLVSVAEEKRREIDGEVQTTAGPAALMRVEAFEAAGGFRGDLLNSETEDLCVRLRRRGFHIWRMEEQMEICDVKKMRRGGWWSRARARGFENAYKASLHGGPPERLGVMDVARAVFWGFVFPVSIAVLATGGAFAAAFFAPMTSGPAVAGLIVGVGVSIYLLKIIASILRRGIFRPSSWSRGYIAVMSRFAEFLGVARFWFSGKRSARAAGR